MAIPSDIAGLYGWYKAESFSLNDGDTCGTWSDSSGNGRNLSVSGTPVYKAGLIAGYPCVRYINSESDYHYHSTFGWTASLANHTIFAVFKSTGTGGAGTFIKGDTDYEGLGYDGTNVFKRSGSAGVFALGGSLAADTWCYAYGCQNGSHSGCSLNGANEVTASATGRGTSGAALNVNPSSSAVGGTVTSAGGGWTAVAASYPDNQNDGDNGTYMAWPGDTAGSMDNYYYNSNIPDNAVISAVYVTGGWGAGSASATCNVTCHLGGNSSSVGQIGDVSSYSFALPRPGGGTWTKSDVGSMAVRFSSGQTGNGNNMKHYYSSITVFFTVYGVDIAEWFIYSSDISTGDKALMIDYLNGKYFDVVPTQNDRVRDVLSRRLWLLRRANGLYEVTVPLHMLKADILDRVAVESRLGPDPSGEGWKSKKWQRRQFSVQRIDVNPGDYSAKLLLLDRRPLDVVMWDNARSNVSGLAPLDAGRENGVARITRGNERAYTRPSKAWVVNPADETSCVEVVTGRPSVSFDGEMFEPTRVNQVTRSSFVSGTTGLTLSGTGTNGSAIAVDTTDNLFNSESGADSLQFTAGNAHTADLRAAFPATATITANTKVCLSIDHKTDSGEPLYWRLQRSVDSWYYNATTPAWQAGAVDNALVAVDERDPAERFILDNFSVGGSNTTLTLSVVLPSGGTASRVSHLYHVQIEEGEFATSRIISDATAYTRHISQLYYTETDDNKMWDRTRAGTFYCEFIPEYDSPLSAQESVLMLANDGTYYDLVYYDAVYQEVRFRRHTSSGTYDAVLVQAVDRGTVYKIAARWTGEEGELDLTNHTLHVFCNGTKSDGVVANGEELTYPLSLYVGGNVATENASAAGVVRNRRIYPYALTDEEIINMEVSG